MKKNITLTINGDDIRFEVDNDDYNKFVNEMQPTSKVAPAQNFLMRTVVADDKDALKKLLELPGAGIDIVGNLVQEYTPALSITVGKSSVPPSE
ncbi:MULTISPECIES: putative phage tail assembly chaperone [unclassified Pseudodesulfovibrio]|uniref:putative phage tail assembly chaperone n=1 Tax=unclassified Pseudodesulfovibrio TaxID=2661612 RepID=UPI000FEB9E72|nr:MULTISPECIES: putative phage tail assembly chaperone [unclassified Pseudodesulfovibrio]MCJ2164659.1 putative phage tail assembly chaperone [Pseudodesulfovibrio sp. S3-i]RWU04149.1 hypothetical protein DWB63_09080 [Pseudodesulfovibrio sp. S3]